MLLKGMTARLATAVVAAAVSLGLADRRLGPVQGADQDRLRHGADRPARRQRQVGAARPEDLGGGRQRQGRAARPSGQADLLRRPDQSGDGAGHLHQAARRRQGRPRHRRLRHQHARAGDAGRDAEEQAVHRPVRPRGEHRVQLSELLRDDPVRAGSEAGLHQGLLRHRAGAEPEAADGRDRRRRRRVLAQRLRRRARERQEGRPQDRLRQDLSAGDHRLRADRARDPGDQSRHRGDLLLSARLGRHGEGGQRDRLQAEDDRRRHGRPAGDRVQDPARPAAQRLRQLRLLAAGRRR